MREGLRNLNHATGETELWRTLINQKTYSNDTLTKNMDKKYIEYATIFIVSHIILCLNFCSEILFYCV